MLYTLCHHLSVAVNSDDKLYADLIGFQTPTILFRQHRLDACIVTSKGEIYAIELTVCYEHNTTKAREYKEQRYRNLQDEIEIENSVFEVAFIEITTRGLTPKTTIECEKLLKQFKVDYDRLFSKCCEVAIRTSYYIFCRRNKEWDTSFAFAIYNLIIIRRYSRILTDLICTIANSVEICLY